MSSTVVKMCATKIYSDYKQTEAPTTQGPLPSGLVREIGRAHV